jgi:hypothetical protein
MSLVTRIRCGRSEVQSFAGSNGGVAARQDSCGRQSSGDQQRAAQIHLAQYRCQQHSAHLATTIKCLKPAYPFIPFSLGVTLYYE